MLRAAALALGLLLTACSAAPAAPSASPTPSATFAAASPSPTTAPPSPTTSPAPTAARTPISLPSSAQIDAPSGTVVWVMVGDQQGRLFRSADRGDTWRESVLPPIVPSVFSFIDDREGWAMLQRIGVPPPAGGRCGTPVTLSHTTDGGTTWQEIVPTGMPAPGPCRTTIHFADAQRGFIAAIDPSDPAGLPIVYRSVDGGRSWIGSRLPDPPGKTPLGTQNPYLGVGRLGAFGATILVTAFPSDPATGTSYIYRSTDNGATWAYAGTAPNNAQDVAFVTATRWLQIASPGDAKETTDGGASWHAVATDYQQAAPIAPAVVFGDAQTGYATVRGAIQRTIDGGAHWTAIKTPGTF